MGGGQGGAGVLELDLGRLVDKLQGFNRSGLLPETLPSAEQRNLESFQLVRLPPSFHLFPPSFHLPYIDMAGEQDTKMTNKLKKKDIRKSFQAI